MRVGAAFLQTFSIQVLQAATSVATSILIARGLGPEGQGKYATFAAAVGLGVVLGSLGQSEGNVLSAAGKSGSGRILLARAVAQGLGIAVLLLLGIPVLRVVFPDTLAQVAGIFTVVLSLEVVAQLLRGITLGQHHIISYNLSTLIQRVTYLTAVASLAAAGGG